MKKILLAAAAAFAFVVAAPAYAGCPDCKDCPQHKVATADKAEKKEGDKVACKCNAETKGECKACGEKCHCPHCHGGEKKDETKKS